MKPILMNLSDMSDSREIMEHKIFPAGVVFIYMTLAVLLAGLTWSYFGELDVVVKARGQIKPSSKIHTLKNKITGTVTEVYVKNGDKVTEGDLLYSVNKERYQLKLLNAENKLSTLTQEHNLLKLFKESIETGENLFLERPMGDDKNVDDLIYDRYKNEYEQFELEEVQSQRSIDFIEKKLNQSKKNLEGYQDIQSKVENGSYKNITDEASGIYDLKLLTYASSLEQKNIDLEEKRLEVKRNKALYDTGALSKNIYESSVQSLKQVENEIARYKAQFKLENEEIIEATVLQIAQYESELKRLMSYSSEGKLVTSNKTAKLIALSSEIQLKEDEIKLIKENIKTLEDQLSMTDIAAPFSGSVNMDVEISPGDYLESGKFIGSVIPDNGESFRLQLKVPNKDIADIEIGDRVKCKVDALPYKEFGMVEGEVVRISASSTGNPDSNSGYYIIEAKIPNVELTSYKGEVSGIKVGMLVEGHIVTRTKKVLFILLEKLNFMD
ncbi:HlyD family efflux transporter periplasmic adaptor subunit [Fusibacter sp. JL216-2]|uniref:HlyD family efflux transporter periplasmic adaptor subunit n=1 Tax=Fusibacter sp. JL216-2 TaxID=3071453 RepID=UPI003D33BA3A